jgi:hypothetical protein
MFLLCGAVAWSWNKGMMSKFIHKLSRVKTKILDRVSRTPFEKRPISALPDQWKFVSIETALNSRCTSDSDGDQTSFHWGLAEARKRLSGAVIADVANMAIQLPQFSGGKADIHVEQNQLRYTVPDSHGDETDYRKNMVQSGVRQQAVGLMAAAMGIGYGFRSVGKNGRPMEGNVIQTVTLTLNPMQPSYQGAYWSKLTPESPQAWRKGNLPNPSRDGRTPLISVMERLKSECRDGAPLTSIRQLGQLLWACKGRTPHMYLGKRWGLTIPTYHGHQELTHMVYSDNRNAYRYINWEADRPTHSLRELPASHPLHSLNDAVRRMHPPFNCFIIWQPQEESSRAYWEIGFQLFNFIVQATSLGLAYEIIDLNHINGPERPAGGDQPPGLAAGMMQRAELDL